MVDAELEGGVMPRKNNLESVGEARKKDFQPKSLTSLKGVLKCNFDYDELRKEFVNEKYGLKL